VLLERWNGIRWGVEAGGFPGGFLQDAFFTGVAAVPGARPWAVGYYSTGTGLQTLAETPRNDVWRQVPTRNPGGPGHDSEFFAVAATSAASAWAVGTQTPAASRSR
jgi:hypothetical protein